MTMDTELLLIANDFGALALTAISFGQLHRLQLPRPVLGTLQGGVFGLGALYSHIFHALSPSAPSNAAMLVCIGFASAFLGVPGALAALLVAIGPGMLIDPGLLRLDSMLLAAIAGRIWAELSQNRTRSSMTAFASLCILLSLAAAPLDLFLTGNADAHTAQHVAHSTILVTLFTAVLSGLFLRERHILALERRLRNEAKTDPLTGLLNRRAFNEGIPLQSTRAKSPAHALLLLDIDHFKSINDRLGHHGGDDILRDLACLLKNSIRLGGEVYRLGGEEFAILMQAETVEEAHFAANRIRSEVESCAKLKSRNQYPVTISVGIGWHDGKTPFQQCLEATDAALYAAKRNGRNRVAIASTEQDAIDSQILHKKSSNEIAFKPAI